MFTTKYASNFVENYFPSYVTEWAILVPASGGAYVFDTREERDRALEEWDREVQSKDQTMRFYVQMARESLTG